MRTALVVCVLVALVACTCATTFINCGSSKDDFQISNIILTPEAPRRGQQYNLTMEGTLQGDGPVSGTVETSVYFAGQRISDKIEDICVVAARSGYPCPMPLGPFTFSFVHYVPPYLYSGHYKGKIVATDTANRQIMCIQYDYAVPSNAPAAGTERAAVDTEVAAELQLEAPVLDDAIIEHVNSRDGWKAKRHAKFEGMTVREARRLLGTKTDVALTAAAKVSLHAEAIPDTFDARTQWPSCVHAIRDQQQCGSCWAFGATEAFSDRLCIATNGAVNVVLSPEDLVSCDSNNYGCDGGYLDLAWQYMMNQGVPTDACVPYTAGTGVAPACTTTCVDGSKPTRYFVKAGTIAQPADVASIQTLIMTSGPVEGAFNVYQDFFSYASGVYYHKTGGLAGGHAIKIVGWGVDTNGMKYWICANSWGTSWGIDGFFLIKRGTNECGIESNVVAGMPDV